MHCAEPSIRCVYHEAGTHTGCPLPSRQLAAAASPTMAPSSTSGRWRTPTACRHKTRLTQAGRSYWWHIRPGIDRERMRRSSSAHLGQLGATSAAGLTPWPRPPPAPHGLGGAAGGGTLHIGRAYPPAWRTGIPPHAGGDGGPTRLGAATASAATRWCALHQQRVRGPPVWPPLTRAPSQHHLPGARPRGPALLVAATPYGPPLPPPAPSSPLRYHPRPLCSPCVCGFEHTLSDLRHSRVRDSLGRYHAMHGNLLAGLVRAPNVSHMHVGEWFAASLQRRRH